MASSGAGDSGGNTSGDALAAAMAALSELSAAHTSSVDASAPPLGVGPGRAADGSGATRADGGATPAGRGVEPPPVPDRVWSTGKFTAGLDGDSGGDGGDESTEETATAMAAVMAMPQMALAMEVLQLRSELARTKQVTRRQLHELSEENSDLKRQVRSLKATAALKSKRRSRGESTSTGREEPTAVLVERDASHVTGLVAPAWVTVHGKANVLCCRFCTVQALDARSDKAVEAVSANAVPRFGVSGGADRRVVLFDVAADSATVTEAASEPTAEPVSSIAFKSPVLSLAVCPLSGCGHVMAATFMDGRLALLAAHSEASGSPKLIVVASHTLHTKYATRVRWSRDGTRLATASRDNSLVLYTIDPVAASNAPAVESLTAGAGESDSDDGEANDTGAAPGLLGRRNRIFFGGPVEALEFVYMPGVPGTPASISAPGSGTHGGSDGLRTYLCASVRGDAKLRFIDVAAGGAVTGVDISEDKSGHVPFSVLDVVGWTDASGATKLLAAATDKDTHIVYDASSLAILRRLTGHGAGGMSQPRLAWHPSGAFLYGNSDADPLVRVWSLASSEIVATVEGHTAVVRDLELWSQGDEPQASGAGDEAAQPRVLLMTASYDKSVRVWAKM